MSMHPIRIDPEILGGTPVFAGTRVPVESLFDHLENGVSLDEFLEDFPSVTRQQAKEAVEIKSLEVPEAVRQGSDPTPNGS